MIFTECIGILFGLITFKKLDMGGVPLARFPWQQQDHSSPEVLFQDLCRDEIRG